MIAALSERIVGAELKAAEALGTFTDRFRLKSYSHPEIWIEADSAKRERTFLIRVYANDYDEEAPQIRVMEGDGSNVTLAQHPLRNDQPFPPHPGAGLDQFLCVDGTRDYYTYSGHRPEQTGISWETQRLDRKLSSLLLTVSRKFASGEWS